MDLRPWLTHAMPSAFNGEISEVPEHKAPSLALRVGVGQWSNAACTVALFGSVGTDACQRDTTA